MQPKRIGFLGCALLFGMLGVGSSATEAQVLELGNFSCPSLAVDWMQQEIDAFSRVHPEYLVRSYALRQPPRYRQPLALLPRLPGVFSIDSESGDEIPYLVSRGLIRPLSHFLPDEDFKEDPFPPGLWESVTWQGERWGMPWLAWSEVLVCNMPMLEAAGIKSPPSNWDDLLAAARVLTRDATEDRPAQWGLRICSDDETLINLFLSLLMQQGGSLTENGRFRLDTPEASAALATLRRLVRDSGVCFYDEEPLEEVLAQSGAPYAMYLGHSRSLAGAMPRTDLTISPIPGAEASGSAAVRRLYFAIRRGSLQEERAAWEFVKWMSRANVRLPGVWGGGFPLRMDLSHRDDFQQSVREGIGGVERLLHAQTLGREWSPPMTQRRKALQAVQDALEAIIFHDASEVVALRQAADAANGLAVPASEDFPSKRVMELVETPAAVDYWASGHTEALPNADALALAGLLERNGEPLIAHLLESHPENTALAQWVLGMTSPPAPGAASGAVPLAGLWRIATDVCSASHALQRDDLLRLLPAYRAELSATAEAADAETLALLRMLNESVFNRSWRLLGKYGYTVEDTEAAPEGGDALRALLQAHLRLLGQELRSAGRPRELTWARAVDKTACFARWLGDTTSLNQSFALLADCRPEASLASEYLWRAVVHARDEMQDVALTENLAQRVHLQFPDSPEAPRALLTLAQSCWRSGRPDESVQGTLLLLGEYPQCPEAPEARYLLALAEAALALDEQAGQDMALLVDEWPAAPVAQAGRYWLAQRALAQGHTARAAEHLRRLLYMENHTPLAGAASALLARIAPSAEHSQGENANVLLP